MTARRLARQVRVAAARRLTHRQRRWLAGRVAVVVEWVRRLSAVDPATFRARLRLAELDDVPLGPRLLDWQRRDFAALDAAWMTLAGLDPGDRPLLRRAYLERPRGHSKTTDLAVQLAWLLRFSPRVVTGVVAAADLDQARLLKDALARLVRANPVLWRKLAVRSQTVRNVETGAEATFLTSDVASSFGLTPDFVVCDELCHWPDEKFWESLASSAAKRPDALLVVLSNAGTGLGWTWAVREAARLGSLPGDDGTPPMWHFSSLDGPDRRLISDETLAEQRRLLPPGVFDRLWMNRWQHAGSGLCSPEEVAACLDESLAERDAGVPGVRYVAAVDYAEKHDLTACCVLHREPTVDADGTAAPDRFVVDRLDVFVPTPEKPTPVRAVRDWIVRTAAAFGDVKFIVDDFQLIGLVQELAGTYEIERFQFRSGKGNHDLARTLRVAVAERRLAFYPGCGARDDRPEDDLAAELTAVRLVEKPDGRVRIDHDRDGHDDRVFAVGLAVLTATGMGNKTDGELWRVEEGDFGGGSAIR